MTSPPTWAVRTKADQHALEQGCQWDEAKAAAIVRFAEAVFAPQFVHGQFRLLDWQRRFLQSVYGWRTATGQRRFKTVNLHIPKKQGKTLLVSVVCLFELLNPDIASPFVASASVSKENAGQVFAELRNSVTKAGLSKFAKITPNQKRIRIPDRNAEYRSLASDGDRVQGYNCSCVVLDECHAHKSADLYDSLRYSYIARPDGMLVAISTAGDNVTHWYYALYQKSKRVLAGEDLDTSHYAEVYEADPAADFETDRGQWHAANPSLGTSFTEDDFARDIAAARHQPAEWMRFLRYRANVWVRPDETAWLDVQQWDRAKRIVSDVELRQAPCYLGVDLSQTTDPSSVSAVWVLPDRRFYVRSWAWVCRGGVELRETERANLPLYTQFAAEKTMTITAGNRIDDRLILDFILGTAKTYRAKKIVFDATSAVVLMGQVEQAGYCVERLAQTHRNYSGVMKAFAAAVVEERVQHDGNGWLRYCLGNVRVDMNRDGEIRPYKKISLDKIDGAVAALMAFIPAVTEGTVPPRPTAYQKRGILLLG